MKPPQEQTAPREAGPRRPDRGPAQIAPNKDAAHPFDAEHGTDTAGYLSPAEIVTGHEHDAMQYGYSAIAPSVFGQMMARWRQTLSDPQRGPGAYSFVDIGAGKGRAVLLASRLCFRAAIGVELSPELARIARANVAIWQRAGKARCKLHVLHQDALRFRWPRTSLLVFLYNPFACELFEQVLGRLEHARAKARAAGLRRQARGAAAAFGATDLLYANPTCAGLISRRGKWKLLWTERIDMDAPDAAADPYGTAFDRVSCYRLR